MYDFNFQIYQYHFQFKNLFYMAGKSHIFFKQNSNKAISVVSFYVDYFIVFLLINCVYRFAEKQGKKIMKQHWRTSHQQGKTWWRNDDQMAMLVNMTSSNWPSTFNGSVLIIYQNPVVNYISGSLTTKSLLINSINAILQPCWTCHCMNRGRSIGSLPDDLEKIG